MHYSGRFTEIILNGDSSVDYVDEKIYTCSYVLYFQDKNDETCKIAAKSKPPDITRLSAEAWKDLETNKSVKFEVPDPPE